MSDVNETYITEISSVAEFQNLYVTRVLKKLFKDARWTVDQLTCSGRLRTYVGVWIVTQPYIEV